MVLAFQSTTEKRSYEEITQGVLHMTWNTPVVTEVCAGMEVTAYLAAQM